MGVDLVAFAVDSNPDVDPTQLTGDSRSTKSFQGRQTCIEADSGIPSGSGVPPGKHHTGKIPAGGGGPSHSSSSIYFSS